MTGNNTGGMPASLGVKGGHRDGPPHFIDNEDPKRSKSITTSAISYMRDSTVPGGDTSRAATNTPLTGSKHSLYEGGIRVPFVVHGPGIEKGSVCRTPVVGYDYLPTFYDLAGGDASKLPKEVDGVSLKNLLFDPENELPERATL